MGNNSTRSRPQVNVPPAQGFPSAPVPVQGGYTHCYHPQAAGYPPPPPPQAHAPPPRQQNGCFAACFSALCCYLLSDDCCSY